MFHLGVNLGFCVGFLIRKSCQGFLKHSCGFLESFFRVSFRISFMRGQKNKVGDQKKQGPVYFDKISCTCAAQPCTCAAQH